MPHPRKGRRVGSVARTYIGVRRGTSREVVEWGELVGGEVAARGSDRAGFCRGLQLWTVPGPSGIGSNVMGKTGNPSDGERSGESELQSTICSERHIIRFPSDGPKPGSSLCPFRFLLRAITRLSFLRLAARGASCWRGWGGRFPSGTDLPRPNAPYGVRRFSIDGGSNSENWATRIYVLDFAASLLRVKTVRSDGDGFGFSYTQ